MSMELNDCVRPVPSLRVIASLVLDIASVADAEAGEQTRVEVLLFSSIIKSLTKGFLFLLPGFAPDRTDVFIAKFLKAIDECKSVSDGATKNYL